MPRFGVPAEEELLAQAEIGGAAVPTKEEEPIGGGGGGGDIEMGGGGGLDGSTIKAIESGAAAGLEEQTKGEPTVTDDTAAELAAVVHIEKRLDECDAVSKTSTVWATVKSKLMEMREELEAAEQVSRAPR